MRFKKDGLSLPFDMVDATKSGLDGVRGQVESVGVFGLSRGKCIIG